MVERMQKEARLAGKTETRRHMQELIPYARTANATDPFQNLTRKKLTEHQRFEERTSRYTCADEERDPDSAARLKERETEQSTERATE